MHFTQYILMVCISTGSYENRVSKHFAISLNFSCLIASLLSFLLVFFFVRFVVRNLCRSGCKQNSSNFFLPPPPLHSLPFFFFFDPIHNSLFKWQLPSPASSRYPSYQRRLGTEFSRLAWQVTSHPKSPRTTGNEAVQVTVIWNQCAPKAGFGAV